MAAAQIVRYYSTPFPISLSGCQAIQYKNRTQRQPKSRKRGEVSAKKKSEAFGFSLSLSKAHAAYQTRIADRIARGGGDRADNKK